MIRQAVRKPSMSMRNSSIAGAAANAKLTTALESELTSPRRRSNHCASIVREASVSSPCPLSRRAPNPRLITTNPTIVLIGPTRLSANVVAASPIVAPTATIREP